MKKKFRTILIIAIVALLLIAANITEIAVVFDATTSNATKYGEEWLEVIGGDLEKTIDDSKLSTLEFALEVQPFVDDHEKCEEIIRKKKEQMIEASNSICFNVYLATDGWYYIPDFKATEGYIIEKRSWYIGALKMNGKPYVTDPYVDAMTGNICFSVSVMLADGKSIACMDYTMENIQRHIRQMDTVNSQQAVIVTDDGIIAGCSDEMLVGKKLTKEFPEYSGVFSLVKSSEHTVSVNQRGNSIFATSSGFGWYLIVSENHWNLYGTSYIAILVILIVSLSIFGVIITLYFIASRNGKRSQEELDAAKSYFSDISAELREPLDRIINGSSVENIRNSPDYEQEFVSIREAGARLNETVTKLQSYSGLIERKKEEVKKQGKKQKPHDVTLSRRFRAIILSLLTIVTVICVYINYTTTISYGSGQMQRDAASYEYQLSKWINTQKSLLDMFCSNISTNPEKLGNYELMVGYLDRITKQFPEISASYLANPDMEHTVIMNTGWEPDDDWRVEERDWYKELMASEKSWIISSPYLDEQTGLYCVTFAKRVYNDSTGEFLGNFGIDFYMDKLVDILGSSYSDSQYAFLVDAKGEIINHPFGKYQMSETDSTNIVSLPYNSVEVNGRDSKIIKDYDDRYKVIISTRNEMSGFSIYVVTDLFSVYGSALISGVVCIVALITCVILVYILMSNLINLQNRANIKLKESADAAIEADKAKSDFLAQMSHEIRTPINTVLGMNEMILHESSDPKIRDYSANIHSAGKTLLSLINSILDFSKIEDHKMEIIPVEYNTAVMINDLVASVAQRAENKGLKLIVDADEVLPSMLNGDDVRIKQVILNLLTNAVKYTEKGSIKLTVKEESRTESSIRLFVDVTDTGIGIREEDIGALFESFTRLEEKRNRHIEGTGLGMSITTKLLEMMGSKLEVKSVYGEGSSFFFTLEQTIADESPMGNYAEHTEADRESEHNSRILYAPDAKILVVDDNSMNLRVAENFLHLYGIEPELVSSGSRCLELVRSNRYDIIFLDHMMPKMDGIEVIREIRKNRLVPEATRVIVLTANAVIGARERYLSEGFDGYLTKPIENKELEKCLRQNLPEDKKQFMDIKEAKRHEQEAADEDSFSMKDIIGIREICPALNMSAGMANCMDSKEFWIDTASGFVSSERTGELCSAYESKDIKAYRIVVHSMKSAARTIGAELVSEHARLLEFAAADGDTEYIRKHHAGFLTEFRELVEKVKEVLKLWEK